jgi:hypothetical protein
MENAALRQSGKRITVVSCRYASPFERAGRVIVDTLKKELAPTVLPTRVSFQLAAVVAVAVDIGDDEPVQADTDVDWEPQVYSVPVYANEPLISPNATPPVTYTMLQGVARLPCAFCG